MNPLVYNPYIIDSDSDSDSNSDSDSVNSVNSVSDSVNSDSGSVNSGSDSNSSSSTSTSNNEGFQNEGKMDRFDVWKQMMSIKDAPQPPLDTTSSRRTNLLASKPSTYERQTTVVMIDSLDRDVRVYPSPTQMRLQLPRIYKNVDRIDIVQVKFFCGLYSISSSLFNNLFSFTDASANTYSLTIPSGNYSILQLTATIQSLMNASGSGTTFTVTWNPVSARVSISGTSNFSISLFKTPIPATLASAVMEWGLGWTLGWMGPPAPLTSTNSYTAPGAPRIPGRDYVYLQLNDTEHMNQIDHTGPESVSGSQNSAGQVGHYFGKLLLNDFGCYAQSFIEAPKQYNPVLPRLERLQIAWLDRHGVVLTGTDATTCDWHMTIRITELVYVAVAVADADAVADVEE
jgi:hypothetical protein